MFNFIDELGLDTGSPGDVVGSGVGEDVSASVGDGNWVGHAMDVEFPLSIVSIRPHHSNLHPKYS